MATEKINPLVFCSRWWALVCTHRALVFNTLLLTAFTAVLVHLYSGYAFFVDDHLVLSLKGLEKFLPGIYSKDYIVQNSNQAHWLFEYLTYIGPCMSFFFPTIPKLNLPEVTGRCFGMTLS
jgi:hypothetical protein